MAGSVNKVIIVGYLGNDPEIKAFSSGGQMARLSVATSESWTDKASGQKTERTEWHRVVVMEPRLVQVCEQYLSKGRLVYVEGQLQTRSWDDKETGQKRSATEIKARSITMLGPRAEGASGRGYRDEGDQPDDEDVPF